jgi:hypothetical protein
MDLYKFYIILSHLWKIIFVWNEDLKNIFIVQIHNGL